MQLQYSSVYGENMRASSIIEGDRWNIPTGMWRHAPDVATLLEDTEIHGENDEIVWGPAANGMYNLADTYEFMRKKKPAWEWNTAIWFRARIPRHAFIAWMALWRGLKTLGKLKLWGVVNSDICVHCWMSKEIEDHLFFECLLAR